MIIQMFRDRERELRELGMVVRSKKSELAVIYGRRRVGKTELVLKATEGTKRLYYLSVGEKNLERFYALCCQHYPAAASLKIDWEVLFSFLKDHAEVVVIDEFPNLIAEDPNILHLFQSIVDVVLRGSSLKLFLLGSSVSVMTSRVLDYKSPLYGRRTASLRLRPVGFFDLCQFFPGRSVEELVEIYGFADGIPLYLAKIRPPFWQWLQEEAKSEKTFLRDEIDFLMRYEFNQVGTYKVILEAIAHGKTKLNEIKDFLKASRTDISPYLRNLAEVGMIERTVPVTERAVSRLGRYRLTDHFIAFWFRFIYPSLSAIEEGIFDVSSVRRGYPAYLGKVFEDVCTQFLARQRARLFPFTSMGRWWYKGREIDIICFDESRQQALFVECKWSALAEREARRILHELKEKAAFVDGTRKKEWYGLIAKSVAGKVRLRREGWHVFDLRDMGEAMRAPAPQTGTNGQNREL